MGEGMGKNENGGFFKEKPPYAELIESRAQISEGKKVLLELTELIAMGRELLESDDEMTEDRREHLTTELARMESDLEADQVTQLRLQTLYDELYKVIYGELPN